MNTSKQAVANDISANDISANDISAIEYFQADLDAGIEV